MVYGPEAVLPVDKLYGAPRLQHYDEGEIKEYRQVDLDSVKECRLAALLNNSV